MYAFSGPEAFLLCCQTPEVSDTIRNKTKMFRFPSRNNNIWTAILVVYCFLAVYYIGLITPNNRTVSSPATNEDLNYEVKAEIPRKEIVKSKDETIVQNVKHYTEQRSEIQTYEHPLQPNFALSGGLRTPRPGYKLGNIKKGSKVVIGIPTVKREGKNYLPGTVHSLLLSLIPRRADVRIVVFIGEIDPSFIREQANIIAEKFPEQIEDGTLEVISPPTEYYPDWSKVLPLTFGDSFERVKWRSKQNLDQIFLMMYIYNLAPEFYLMMEDDVIASEGYMEKIMKYVEEMSNDDWFYISFCNLGAIGKLFQHNALPPYSTFLHMFWNRKPLDWLQIDFVRAKVCSFDENEQQCQIRTRQQTPMYSPSLFQHIGKVSSLKGKLQLLKDHSFKE